MDSDSTTPSPNKVKQEPTTPKARGSGRNTKKTPNSEKKRNLVRWNDDVDKQVLLTLQWACNEVGIKPPWDLVAKTMGNGITAGAIIQHLAKLRGKMIKAEIMVPPKLSRGTVAKEPSRIYATSNGKKLPPPVFANPFTAVQATPKSKPKSKGKNKRARADLEDSEEEINDYVEDSDEDYGTLMKKARPSRAKLQMSAGKASSKKFKVLQTNLTAADEEINDDILRTLEDEDGGPASRTRHIKQNFTHIDEAYTDVEEDEEEEEEGGGEEVTDRLENQQMRSRASIKEEDVVSPRTLVPNNNHKVAQWSEDVVTSMQPNNLYIPVTADQGVEAYGQQPMYRKRTGLNTPRPSRNTSATTLTAPTMTSTAPMNFLGTPEHNMAYGSFLANTDGIPNPMAPVHFNGFGNQTSNLNQGVGDLGMTFGEHDFDTNTPFRSADLTAGPGESDPAFLEDFPWEV